MILAIESAIAGGSLSVIKDGHTVARWNGRSDVSRAEDLLPAVENMMAEAAIERSALSMIAVSVGPGSFTGIRIGMSTGLGLSTGLRIPMSSVSVLKAMASAMGAGAVLAAVPMGRSSICIQSFSNENGMVNEHSEPTTLSESDFADYIGARNGTVAVHRALTSLAGDRDIVDLGLDLASLVGKYCQEHPNERERPLFISKSF